jgi:hypothetical protein
MTAQPVPRPTPPPADADLNAAADRLARALVQAAIRVARLAPPREPATASNTVPLAAGERRSGGIRIAAVSGTES